MSTVGSTSAPKKSTPAATEGGGGGNSVTVKKGDSLTSIAEKKLGTKDPAAVSAYVSQLAQANHLKDPNKIAAGQTLSLPEPTGAAAPKPAAPPAAPAVTAQATGGGAPAPAATAQSKTEAESKAKAAGSTPQSAAEVKWANDFKKTADDKMKKAGVPDDQRKRVTDHLNTLSGPALARECNMLDHALKSKNADRAVGTYDKTLTMSKESPRAAERLTPSVREELVRGVADSRTKTDKGAEGVMGQRQAEEAARALVDMPKSDYDRLQGAMNRAGQGADGKPVKGADAHTERALMLKAVGARGDRLKESALDREAEKKGVCMDTPSGRAMGEVMGFSDNIRGMKRDELIANTSTLAINAKDKGPNYRDIPAGDTQKNVGHYQRYDASCGPTTAQNMQAERDPVFALKMRKEEKDPGINTDIAKQQKDVLEKTRFYDNNANEVTLTPAQLTKYNQDKTLPPGVQAVAGTAYSRMGGQADTKLDARMNDAWGLKHLTTPEWNALDKVRQNQKTTPAEDTAAKSALDKIRKKDGGHPTAAEMDAMRSNYTQNADGTSTKKAEHTWMYLPAALNDIAPPAAGKSWQIAQTNGGNGGMNNADVAALDKKLKGGTDVPIRICNANGSGGHFMMISDVRGDGANKKYLVSDPWSGKTAWVKENDLKNFNSGWPNKQFSSDLATGVSHTYSEV